VSALDRIAGRLGDVAQRDVPLGPFTTYRVGGPAAVFVEVDDEATLRLLADAIAAADEPVPTLVVGKGSNLLVADAGFAGLALRLGGGFADVRIDGVDVLAGGAAALPVLARQTAAAGLTGLEWAVGVPGSVGGGVRMNAGGHGSDIAGTLTEARVLDLHSGEDRLLSVADLALGYRRSAIQPHHVVCAARFHLAAGDAATATAEISEIVAWRRDNQPGGQNAGSVFTNPDGDSAGRLIDAAGGKGLRHGSAEVSPKHANFIQADPGGSADDVHALMLDVQALVLRDSGVLLEPETRLIGFPQEDA
jgi:UDP-N-acetylmuramate dehydrogenase